MKGWVGGPWLGEMELCGNPPATTSVDDASIVALWASRQGVGALDHTSHNTVASIDITRDQSSEPCRAVGGTGGPGSAHPAVAVAVARGSACPAGGGHLQ